MSALQRRRAAPRALRGFGGALLGLLMSYPAVASPLPPPSDTSSRAAERHRSARFAGIEMADVPSRATSGRTGSVSAAMDGWMVLAEKGLGLRFVPGEGGHACHGDAPRRSGFLPLTVPVRALTALGGWVYAAVDNGGILRVDATHPEAPAADGWVRRPSAGRDSSPVESLDVLGTTLYALARDHLEILDAAQEGGEPEVHPEVNGIEIHAGGRLLRVVREDGAMVAYRDTSSVPLQFEVTVGNNFFSPQSLSVAVGDTVRWTNLTGHLHNVFSCTLDQTGCAAAAAEPFQSGSPSEFFVYDHTFVMPGENGYLCQPHAPFMSGTITVTGSAGTPPGVPDGATGVPVRAVKVAADGSTLSVTWDTTSCQGATDHQILYGYPYGLPPATGGAYEPAGSRCSIGSASPFTWTSVPPAFPGPSGLVWWLIVATDGEATEGSWGKTSSGLERQGPGADGSSLECGTIQKNLANTCGQQ